MCSAYVFLNTVYCVYSCSVMDTIVVYGCVLVALVVCSCVWLCPSSAGCM